MADTTTELAVHAEIVEATAEVEPEEDASDIPAHEALAQVHGVPEMVAAFQRLEETVRATFASIVDAERVANIAFGAGDRTFLVSASYSGHDGDDFDRVDRAIERLRRVAWKTLVERLSLRRWLSAESWKKVGHFLDKGEPEPVTVETVEAFLDRWRRVGPDAFRAKCVEVFEWLRPPSDSHRHVAYKTNQKNARLELGPRIILTGAVQARDHGCFYVSHYSAQRLTALDAVFSGLDGQGMAAATHHGPIHDAIEASTDGTGETRYFAFKAHKNGTLHLRFRRLDLLDRLNRIAGGMNLRPAEDTHAV